MVIEKYLSWQKKANILLQTLHNIMTATSQRPYVSLDTLYMMALETVEAIAANERTAQRIKRKYIRRALKAEDGPVADAPSPPPAQTASNPTEVTGKRPRGRPRL